MADEPQDNRDGEKRQQGEEVDPELVALAENRSRGSALRPLLFAAVIGLGVWIIGDMWTDISYFFTPSSVEEIGSLTEMASEGEGGDWQNKLPHNRYVEIGGIPKRRSQSRKYRYFKLVGAPVYVEVPREKKEGGSLAERIGKEEASGSVDRTYFNGKGRIVAFGKAPQKYLGLKHYYRRKYGTRFCEMLDEKDERRIRRERRQAVIENWRERWENASPTEREDQEITKEPTEQEIDEILGASPICVEAYLVRIETEPWDHWWYVATALLFGLFMLVNLYWLGRWFRQFFGSDVDLSHLQSADE